MSGSTVSVRPDCPARASSVATVSTSDNGHHWTGVDGEAGAYAAHLSGPREADDLLAARLPGISVNQVARRYDVNANLLFNWLRDSRFAPE